MSSLGHTMTVHRAREIWFTRRSRTTFEFVALADAAIAVEDGGKILAVGDAQDVRTKFSGAKFLDHKDAILCPGFIDAHLHCPQLDVIGSGGLPLLGWLEEYVFPAEAKFAERSVSRKGARRLVRELKRHGVTTSAVFSSVHTSACDELFSEFDQAGLRLVSGKTSMDLGAPHHLVQPVETDIEDQQALIAKWHGKSDRLFYAITPRFALSCSKKMMTALGRLKENHPSCFVQTHIAETTDEVEAVKAAWPESRDYLAVYEDHGLLGAKTLLAHGIYLSDAELKRIALTGSTIVHCPTSNSFLGSGLFNLQRAIGSGAKVCLASDIGAGTGLSPWQTMLESYKVHALQGINLTADELFYRSTLAGAESLGLGDVCGSLEVGKYADFVVVKPSRHLLLGERLSVTKNPLERLLACVTYGDDRIIDSTYVAGVQVYRQMDHEHFAG